MVVGGNLGGPRWPCYTNSDINRQHEQKHEEECIYFELEHGFRNIRGTFLVLVLLKDLARIYFLVVLEVVRPSASRFTWQSLLQLVILDLLLLEVVPVFGNACLRLCGFIANERTNFYCVLPSSGMNIH